MQPHKPSPALKALTRLFLPLSLTLGLAACATTNPPPLQIPVPDSLRASCERPSPDAVQTVGDLAAYSARQDAAVRVCDARRAAVVAIVDGANAVVKPKRKKVFGIW